MKDGFCGACDKVLTKENCAARVFKKNRGRCRECLAAYQSKWDKNNPDKKKAYKDIRRKERPEEIRAYDNEYYRSALRNNPEYKKRMQHLHRKLKFGMAKDVFELLLKSQNNKCAICHKEFEKTPCVDHCHTTNRNRGLLCGNCNKGLGHFFEKPEVMMSAIAYIEKYKLILG
jgi:hypothetical protein